MMRKSLAVSAAAAALLVGAAVPAEAAESQQCSEGSRSIDTSGVVEGQAVVDSGSSGRAEITLRSIPGENCYWGLIEGKGVIWLERVSWYADDDGPRPSDVNLHYQTNHDNGVNHTAATVTSEHSVRACGQAFNGTDTRDSGITGNVSVEGKTPSIGGEGGSNRSETFELDTDYVCTDWEQADLILPNTF